MFTDNFQSKNEYDAYMFCLSRVKYGDKAEVYIDRSFLTAYKTGETLITDIIGKYKDIWKLTKTRYPILSIPFGVKSASFYSTRPDNEEILEKYPNFDHRRVFIAYPADVKIKRIIKGKL